MADTPNEWDVVRLYGKYGDKDETGAYRPAQGSITISFNARLIVNQNGEKVIYPGPEQWSAPLDAEGYVEVWVPAADDPDISPTGWSVQVQESFTDGHRPASYWITPSVANIPDGINLADVVVPGSQPSVPNSLIKGVPGGVASLDSTGKVPIEQLPEGGGGVGGPSSTDELPEGSTNLYYTDERAGAAAEAVGDARYVQRYLNLPDEGPVTEPITQIVLGYLTDPNTSPDLRRVYDFDGNLLTWFNEWGGLRGTPSTGLKDDALVRGVARTDLGPTAAGAAFEMVNRTFPTGDPRRQSIQVGRWRDGAILRNGVEMSLVFVRTGSAAIPEHLPDMSAVLTIND